METEMLKKKIKECEVSFFRGQEEMRSGLLQLHAMLLEIVEEPQTPGHSLPEHERVFFPLHKNRRRIVVRGHSQKGPPDHWEMEDPRF
jgi:hypothetical protein